jgi:FkbM family methyltransferase
MRPLISLVQDTALEFPLRRLYHRISGLPPLSDWEYRDLRDHRHAVAMLREIMAPDSVAIDVGAHYGVFLREFLRVSPHGRHIAIEPIPDIASTLRQHFPTAELYECALSDCSGTATFQYVPSLPGWSGLRAQPYPIEVTPTPITVSLRRLDELVDPRTPVRFIKIDVEGAELEVLRGAQDTLRRWHPPVFFECGKVHHLHYETTPEEVWDLLHDCGMDVCLLTKSRLSRAEFRAEYERSYQSGYDHTAWGNYLALPHR